MKAPVMLPMCVIGVMSRNVSYGRSLRRLGLMVSALIATPKVWPSGAAATTACVPMTVPPPGWFSTTTGWPHSSESFCPIGRTIASVAPPASSGEIRRTGCVGLKLDCANDSEGAAATAAAPATNARRLRREEGWVMVSPWNLY